MHYIKQLVPQSLKNIYHLGQAILANLIYGFSSRKIKVIGVTGTNGKTTTVQMIAKILEEAGHKVAVASTINFKMNGDEEINKTKFTTLSSFQVQKFIRKAVKNGCEYLVLETSSHSLDQYRTWGIDYHTAVITNVTREHLDYHKTIDKYRQAKLKMFCRAKVAVVNLDMENPSEYLSCGAGKKYGYTVCHPERSEAESKDLIRFLDKLEMTSIAAENIELGIDGSQFTVHGSQFQLNLLGEFNIENALAATCVGLAENIDLETISQALEKIKLIPGRMESVPNNRGINIIIDYAVTPDSLEKLYGLVGEIRGKKDEREKGGKGDAKIIAVFGSCGERDRGKRPIMGGIVSECANYVILTDEDPYGEDPIQIINEVFSGVVGYEVKGEFPNYQISNSKFQTNSNEQNPKSKTEGLNCWRILNRREAIKKALQIAKPGDFVIVTGKGAEEVMAVGKKRIPWNDKKVILEELQKL